MTNGGKRSVVPGLDHKDSQVVFHENGFINLKTRSGQTARECSEAKRFASWPRRGASRREWSKGGRPGMVRYEPWRTGICRNGYTTELRNQWDVI